MAEDGRVPARARERKGLVTAGEDGWPLVAAAAPPPSVPPAGSGTGAAGPALTEEGLRRGYQEMGPLNQRLAEEWLPGELEPRRWDWGGEGG
ncbi:MAG TPA: DEAD/DEAH box helicase [Thermaerobacter sp.]